MALNRIDYPSNLTDQSDFSAHGELIESRYLDQTVAPLQVRDGVIPQGVVLQIGGVLYRSDTDTSITGTASDYVRVTPDGATASAAYVADLSGVAWNAQYNGYYDSQSPARLYLFNEKLAQLNGDVETIRTRYVEVDSVGDAWVPRDFTAGRYILFKTGQGFFISSQNVEKAYSEDRSTDFASPAAGIQGVVIDPTGNLISCDLVANRIYVHNGISSTVTTDFATPASNITGIAIDPATGNLISCDSGTNRIYVHNGISSTVTSSFASPAGSIRGLTINPATGNLISCDSGANRIYVHDGIGSTVTSNFATPASGITGIAIDPATGNLISCDFGADRIYVHDGISSTVTSSFASPATAITGVAIDPATGNLISCDIDANRIYVHRTEYKWYSGL